MYCPLLFNYIIIEPLLIINLFLFQMEQTQQIDNEEFESLIVLMKERSDLVDKQSKDTRLKMYSAGKQGKAGDCKDPKPGMFDVVGKIKWQAWKDRTGQDQNACKIEFMEIARVIMATDKKQ